MKKFLFNIGVWLVATFGEKIEPLPHIEDELLTIAKKITAQIQKNWPETDGEFKRAKAYAQLVNTFPQRAKQDISYAIEDAVKALCSVS